MTGKLRRMGMLAGLVVLLAVCSTGCLFQSVEDLYTLPALPEGYTSLQKSIRDTMSDLGAEYATINFGNNTATVQQLDLDGDGDQESAAVFLRVTGTEEKPLRVCLFRRGEDGKYYLNYEVAGDGTSINSVAYEDLTGDGNKELVVSWQMTARVHKLSAYSLTSAGATELMNTTYNESYLITELDQQKGSEILVFQRKNAEEEISQAEYYRYQDGAMVMVSSAPLSDNIQGVNASRNGRLSDGKPGVYVNGLVNGGEVTDIFTLQDGVLRNITRDERSGISSATFRGYTDVDAADINGDGVLEIPRPYPLPTLEAESEAAYYVLSWQQFDSAGNEAVICATYHSVTDGWYLILPDTWVGQIRVDRDDSMSARGERAVSFYYSPEGEETRAQRFLTIYRLTGNNRSSRARLPGRFIIQSDSTAIYAAQLEAGVWDCGVEQESFSQRFRIIRPAWSGQ